MPVDKEMGDKDEELQNVESGSSDSSLPDSDDGDQSVMDEEDQLQLEKPLSEEEIEEIITEFLEVESKTAEAQEALEDESLARVERDVREELTLTLNGDELETAVADEMATFREEWEAALDQLESESANLLEQLDGAGIELPKLYKLIEDQAPNGCCTEAWKKRTHWVGSQLSSEVAESISGAEKYLETHWPVRKRHGKLLEEGASGFLQKKLADDGVKDSLAGNSEVNWSSLNKVFSDNTPKDAITFGSKHWASVYLASTPQQAASMGLEFQGVNEVEEIEDIDVDADPFVADAIANETEVALSEEQRKNFKKVKEEDDIKVDKRLQLHLKRRRHKRKSKLGTDGRAESSVGRLSLNSNKERMTSNELSSAQPNFSEDIKSIDKKTIMVDSIEETDSVKDETLTIRTDDGSALQDNPVSVDECPPRSPVKIHLCTVCHKVADKVHGHPLLKVIVCWDCKCLLEEKILSKDADCSDCYCGWCGQNTELVSCKSCKKLFCTACVKRNVVGECSSELLSSGWECFCCSPSLLKGLRLEFEKAVEDRESTDSSSDGASGNSDGDVGMVVSSKRKRKKKIRRILDDAELGEETKRKIAIEKERQERLKTLQSSARFKTVASEGYTSNITEGAEAEVLGDCTTGYIVNVAREIGEEAVRIPPSISAKLKAHQIAGIRFMWENIVQSISKVRSGDKGLGCILAHTMGLGKTFQVIAFLYTAMRCVDLGLKTVLIVTPVNVLHNWRSEFIKWRPSEVKPLRIFMLEDVSRERRLELLAKWRKKGGVFLIGYAAFRNLSLGKHVKDRNVARELSYILQEGPDILVCDEAHMIKNTRAGTTQALKQVKCQRRIALTGSPLQNNLMEYYCMVDFVREGFLGSSHEFRNRFQNPIENGQHTNSTAEDVKIMNQRSHILYEQLKGFVQRMDMSVVKKDLPPKTVFVIAVKLSALQRKLYKRFLKVYGLTNDKTGDMRKSFFSGYQVLAQILNHPGILQVTKEDNGYGNRGFGVDSFLADESSSDENVDYNMFTGEKQRNGNDYIHGKNDDGLFQKDWWVDVLHKNNYKVPDYSGKMVLLLDILSMCAAVGDKALVFSQSIPTLDLIEHYLSKLPRNGKPGKFWKKSKDWYRLDGKTESSERQRLVERFNEPENKRVKCTLISTRAGSLGINLYAANRVIVVDGSWNPTYDLQAIFRAWRYGQKKPVFAYRLVARGTIEEKIYKRQVTKEGLAARVVDRQQVHRTISKEEMLHLFEFEEDENESSETQNQVSQNGVTYNQNKTSPVDESQKQESFSNGTCSSDKLMEKLLEKHRPSWIASCHEHETLLQENEEEKLSKEEKDMAWEVYRRALEWEEVHRFPFNETVSHNEPAVPHNEPAVPHNEPAAPHNESLFPHNEPATIQKPSVPPKVAHAPLETTFPLRFRGCRWNFSVKRKCTETSHVLTLLSQGTKAGCSTLCGECSQEISWEGVDMARRLVS